MENPARLRVATSIDLPGQYWLTPKDNPVPEEDIENLWANSFKGLAPIMERVIPIFLSTYHPGIRPYSFDLRELNLDPIHWQNCWLQFGRKRYLLTSSQKTVNNDPFIVTEVTVSTQVRSTYDRRKKGIINIVTHQLSPGIEPRFRVGIRVEDKNRDSLIESVIDLLNDYAADLLHLWRLP